MLLFQHKSKQDVSETTKSQIQAAPALMLFNVFVCWKPEVSAAVEQNDEKDEQGVLQQLLNIVFEAKNLMQSNPWILYECIRGIHSLWVHRIERPAPVTSLTSENKFWKSLIQFLQDLKFSSSDNFNLGTAGYILQVRQRIYSV